MITFNPIGIFCALDGSGGQIGFAVISDAPAGTTRTAQLLDSGVAVQTLTLGTGLTGLFLGVADGVYEVVVTEASTSTTASHVVFVECAGSGGGCDLTLGLLQVVVPTSAGGQGYIETITSTTAATVVLDVRSTTYPYTVVASASLAVAGGVISRRLLGITAGDYQLRATDSNGCVKAFAFTMPEYVPEPAPPISGPPIFYAVGGVLPNPVPLVVSVPFAVGRWVEVEIMREAQSLGIGRMTVRTDNPVFDAAPYLRALLSTTPSTGANVTIDTDSAACVEFWYRYRSHDSDGTAGPWVDEEAQQRFAVLAALDGLDDSMAPYVAGAESPGAFTTVFTEPVQFVGLPLSLGLLIPPGLPDDDVFIEFAYLDAFGNEIEIRAEKLDKPAPGYYRFLLPPNPLPCAVKVMATLVNEDRSYEGECASGGSSPAVPGGYLVANGGYIKV